MSHLTVIDSFGGVDTNAYTNVSYANSYMATKFNSEPWAALTEPQKESAILEATRKIDSKNWRGNRFFYYQKLRFPRTLVTSLVESGRTIVQTPTMFDVEYNRQEEKVRAACAEQALWIARTNGRDRYGEAMAAGVNNESESVGGYSRSATYGTRLGLCPEAMELLKEWRVGPKLVRG